MARFPAWVVLSILMCLSTGSVAVEPAGGERRDLYGDPLPLGAVSRLGTNQLLMGKFRFGSEEPVKSARFTCDDFCGFSPDGKLFASRNRLWDVASGGLVHQAFAESRILFAPHGTPFTVTQFEKHLAARPLTPVPPGWEVAVKDAFISPSTGHVLFRVRPEDLTTASSTHLQNVFTGLDVHRLEDDGLAGAGAMPEAWRFGVRKDGRQLALVTRGGQVVLHTLGEAKQATGGAPLAGLSPDSASTTLVSPDGKHVMVLPGHRGGRIQVLRSSGLEGTAALRDATPEGYGGARTGSSILTDATQVAVLRGGGATTSPAILKVWNGVTEGMVANTRIRSAANLRDTAFWLAARGLRGETPAGFIPLDDKMHAGRSLHCQLSSEWFGATVAISSSGELVALADDICISIYETATRQCVQRRQPGEGVVRLVFSPDERLLLAHYSRDTALVFETIQPADELRDVPRKELWNDLAGTNARKARKAMLELARRGDAVLPLFDGAFPKRTTPEEIRRWIAELNGPEKSVQDTAQRKLFALGPVGLPHLQTAVRGNPTDEQIVRLRAILEHPAETVVDPEVLRGKRAIQIAALIGSPAALARLAIVAEGEYDPRIVSLAAETLARLRP